jgi:hypothetical protein
MNLSHAIGCYVPYLSTTGICMSSINIINDLPGILGPNILPILFLVFKFNNLIFLIYF